MGIYDECKKAIDTATASEPTLSIPAYGNVTVGLPVSAVRNALAQFDREQAEREKQEREEVARKTLRLEVPHTLPYLNIRIVDGTGAKVGMADVQRRNTGIYAGAGLYLGTSPEGYAWQVEREQGFGFDTFVLVLAPIVNAHIDQCAAKSTLGYPCA